MASKSRALVMTEVILWQYLGSVTERNGTDMPPPSTQYGFSEAGTGWQHPYKTPSCNRKTLQFAKHRVYTEHFFSVEFVPNLPNNTKCHLFGTHGVQPSSLLHYALDCEACQS